MDKPCFLCQVISFLPGKDENRYLNHTKVKLNPCLLCYGYLRLIQYASKQEKYPNSAETLPPQSSAVDTISENLVVIYYFFLFFNNNTI